MTKIANITVGSFTAAKVRGAVKALTDAQRNANAALEKGNVGFMERIRAMLPRDAKGKNVPVTEAQWAKSIQPLFKDALTEAYPVKGYGPRLSWSKVAVLGLSRGIPGRGGLSSYYEDARAVLEAEGAKKTDKRGANPKIGGSKAAQAQVAKDNANAKLASAGDERAKVKAAIKSPAPGSAAGPVKTVADGEDWRAAALLIFGAPSLASKAYELMCNSPDDWAKVKADFTADVNTRLIAYNARVGK